MNNKKKILFLYGSPKQTSKSASWLLGGFLLKRLTDRGAEIRKVSLVSLVNSKRGNEELVDIVHWCDILVFSSPLYLDCQPSFVIRAMDIIKMNKEKIGNGKGVFAISNCGFPEASQNMVVLNIYKQFTKELNFNWLGGVAVGMGHAYITGCYFLGTFGAFSKTKKAFMAAADNLMQPNLESKMTNDFVINPIMPSVLYLTIAIFLARIVALTNLAFNLHRKLGDVYE
jgi:multimeric flavodoxin WrbA